jgi:hypothetical protein
MAPTLAHGATTGSGGAKLTTILTTIGPDSQWSAMVRPGLVCPLTCADGLR